MLFCQNKSVKQQEVDYCHPLLLWALIKPTWCPMGPQQVGRFLCRAFVISALSDSSFCSSFQSQSKVQGTLSALVLEVDLCLFFQHFLLNHLTLVSHQLLMNRGLC